MSARPKTTAWGRGKKADIASAGFQAIELTVQDLLGYARKRRTEDEAGPATVVNGMVWLGQVFPHASAARGVDAPLQATAGRPFPSGQRPCAVLMPRSVAGGVKEAATVVHTV